MAGEPDIEQIRAALADAKPLYNETMVMSDSLADAIDSLYANAPVWLAQLCDEVERLRAVDERLREGIDVVTAERNAALAECERIKKINALNARQCLAWRACADQLAAGWRDHATGGGVEALAVYEKLKGADS